MGKIDEVKELLNTLRVAMSIAFGILVILIGSIVKRYDMERADTKKDTRDKGTIK